MEGKKKGEMIKIEKRSEEEFENIIHISDIHIRPLERHEEFNKVFNKLYEEIDRIKASGIRVIIVLTGDIFDNKNTFHPETYNICKEFFRGLSRRVLTILIAGNHDMKTIARLDSLTPITSNIENFHYLKESGAYEFGDVIFVVTSLYDSKYEFIRRDQIETKKKCIALYHGTISGTSNEEGYIFKNDQGNDRYRKKTDFDNYDGILLGDIHKHQMIRKNMGYSGSLIQNNFGEPIDKHGYLIWDIKDKNNITAEFKEIKNEYGKVNIIIEDNEWKNKEIKFPEKSYIRLNLTNTTQNQANEIMENIKGLKKTQIIDYHYRFNDKFIKYEENEKMEDKDKTDIEILKEELNKTNYGEDIKKKIIEIHERWKKDIEINEMKGDISVWTPLTMEYKNLFSYAGDNVNKIEFKPGVTSITALNATGKTSIINILLYGIFGELLVNPGKSKTWDLLNNKESIGYIILEIQYGTKVYTIEKVLTRQKNEDIKIEIEIRYIENEKLIIKRNKAAKAKMILMFGTIKDFYKCNVSNSRDQGNDFFRLTDGDKIKYLKNVFKLEYFDEIMKKNTIKMTELKIKIAEEEKHKNILIEDIVNISNEDIDKLNIKLAEEGKILQIKYEENNKKKETINKSLIIEETKIIKMDEKDVTKLKRELIGIRDLYENFEISFDMNQIKNSIMNKRNQLNKVIKETKEEILDKIKETTNEIKKNGKYKPILTKEETYKMKVEYEISKNASEKELNNEITMIKKCNIINKNKTTKLTKEELMIENEKLHKRFKDSEGEKYDKMVEKNKEIKKKLGKTKHVNQDKSESEMINERINSEKKLEKIMEEIKIAKINIKKTNSNGNPIECEYEKIPKIIEKLKGQMKSVMIIETKIKIDEKDYANKLEEIKDIEEELNEITIKSISDEDIDKYIKLIEELESKERLLKKDIVEMKNNLLIPIKKILEEIKKDNIEEDRKQMKILSKRKEVIQKEINKIENDKLQNNNIDKKKKENIKIEEINNKIIEEISNYEYNYNNNQMIILKEKKEELEVEIKSIINHLDNKKLEEELNKNRRLLENIEHNDKLEKEINYNKEQINIIIHEELSEKIKIEEKKLEKLREKLENITGEYNIIICRENKRELECKLEIIIKNMEIKKEIEKLNNKAEYQKIKDRKEKITENIGIIENNIKIKKEIKKKEEEREKVKVSEKELQKRQIENRVNMNELNKKKEKKKKLEEKIKEIIELELEKGYYEKYQIMAGPKGIQTKILNKKIKEMEKKINEVIEPFIGTKIKIGEEEDGKISISTLTGEVELAIERLSTYETLVVNIVWKRVLKSISRITSSGTFIMDESIECIDIENFAENLPKLMNMINESYKYVIVISQRDITHIATNTIKIEKKEDISRIIEY